MAASPEASQLNSGSSCWQDDRSSCEYETPATGVAFFLLARNINKPLLSEHLLFEWLPLHRPADSTQYPHVGRENPAPANLKTRQLVWPFFSSFQEYKQTPAVGPFIAFYTSIAAGSFFVASDVPCVCQRIQPTCPLTTVPACQPLLPAGYPRVRKALCSPFTDKQSLDSESE